MKIRNLLFVLFFSSAIATGLAAPATTEYSDSILQLSEISITAVKRVSNSEHSAGTTNRISQKEVESRNIITTKDISAIIPNFFIPDYGSRITSTIYSRGLGARIDQPVIGLNIDNVPILNKDNYDFDISDIESIEVMKGPQGTLYGRNTMGGVINVSTLSPLSYQGTRIILEYGKENSIKAGVSHYSKPTDNFGISGGLHYYHTDGFFRNSFNGEKCDKENSARASLKLQWQPSEQIIIENSANATITRQGGYPYEFVGTGQISYNDTCFYRRNSFIDGLTLRINSDKVSLTSVTSYQHINDNMTLDQDFLPLPYFTLSQMRKEHAITEDIILKGKNESKIHWLAGIFGFYKRAEMDVPVVFKDYGIRELIESHWDNDKYPLLWDKRNFTLGTDLTLPNFGTAVYGEVSADFERLTLIAGLRFDYERAELQYKSDCSTSYTIYDATGKPYSHRPVEIHNTGKLRRAFTQLLPKISVIYNADKNASFYATAAKGYKAGGFNTQMFSDVLQQQLMKQYFDLGMQYNVDDVVGYKPEKSWNYEIGGKLNFADGKFSAAFSAFYIHCTDQQLTIFPDGTTTGRIMANAGKTRNAGTEITLSTSPIDNLQITASYGYTNAKFLKFEDGKHNYSGKFIPYAPQNTIFANAMYTVETGNGFLKYITAGAGITGAGKIYWNESNSLSQNFYILLNGNIRFSGDNYSLDLWTKNATSTQYSTFYFVSMEHEFLQRGKPSQFGATIRINI